MNWLFRLGGTMAAAALIITSAQAMECARPGERDGMSVRVLQSQLMVAALTCNARSDYNAFVTRYRPQLTEHGKRLKQYFRRAHGKRYKRALNAYVTDLANDASLLSNADREGFCAASRQAFARLLGTSAGNPPGMLTRVAAQTGGARDPQTGCDSLSSR